jgi:hypothetical protein
VEIDKLSQWIHIYWKRHFWKMQRAFFGIKTMPALFQRVMDAIAQEIWEDYDCTVKSFLDDTFNEGGLAEDDRRQCITFIDVCTKYKLRINESK